MGETEIKTRTVTQYRDPAILPVKFGGISEKDRAALRRVGVIVVECENPSDLRLLRPQADLDGGDMLHCALQALVDGKGYTTAADTRQAFTRLIADLVAEKRNPKPE